MLTLLEVLTSHSRYQQGNQEIQGQLSQLLSPWGQCNFPWMTVALHLEFFVKYPTKLLVQQIITQAYVCLVVVAQYVVGSIQPHTLSVQQLSLSSTQTSNVGKMLKCHATQQSTISSTRTVQFQSDCNYQELSAPVVVHKWTAKEGTETLCCMRYVQRASIQPIPLTKTVSVCTCAFSRTVQIHRTHQNMQCTYTQHLLTAGGENQPKSKMRTPLSPGHLLQLLVR